MTVSVHALHGFLGVRKSEGFVAAEAHAGGERCAVTSVPAFRTDRYGLSDWPRLPDVFWLVLAAVVPGHVVSPPKTCCCCVTATGMVMYCCAVEPAGVSCAAVDCPRLRTRASVDAVLPG